LTPRISSGILAARNGGVFFLVDVDRLHRFADRPPERPDLAHATLVIGEKHVFGPRFDTRLPHEHRFFFDTLGRMAVRFEEHVRSRVRVRPFFPSCLTAHCTASRSISSHALGWTPFMNTATTACAAASSD
jgi:hypothetical protein